MKTFFLISILLLTGCSVKKSQEDLTSKIINLLDSAKIIRNMICQNKLAELLEEHDPEQLESLINNFIPAQMALESEVLNCTMLLVVVYYYKESEQSKLFIDELKKLANEYSDKVKFVTIDSDKLFSLAEDAEIDNFPAIIFVKKREITEKIDKDISKESIKQKIEFFINLA